MLVLRLTTAVVMCMLAFVPVRILVLVAMLMIMMSRSIAIIRIISITRIRITMLITIRIAVIVQEHAHAPIARRTVIVIIMTEFADRILESPIPVITGRAEVLLGRAFTTAQTAWQAGPIVLPALAMVEPARVPVAGRTEFIDTTIIARGAEFAHQFIFLLPNTRSVRQAAEVSPLLSWCVPSSLLALSLPVLEYISEMRRNITEAH